MKILLIGIGVLIAGVAMLAVEVFLISTGQYSCEYEWFTQECSYHWWHGIGMATLSSGIMAVLAGLILPIVGLGRWLLSLIRRRG